MWSRKCWIAWVVAQGLVMGGCSSEPFVGAGQATPGAMGQSLACESDETCSEGRFCVSGGRTDLPTGVCMADPAVDEVAVLTDATGLVPYPAETAPNLACVDQAVLAAEGSSELVTLYGAVSRFGSGLVTSDVQVEVFRADQWDPEVCEAIEPQEEQAECYRAYGAAAHAGEYGLEPLGSALSVRVDDDGKDMPCMGHADCALGYECIAGDLDSTCLEQFGTYEISNIPTNTMLVIRTYATTNERKWHDVYTFGVYLFEDQVTDDKMYHYDVTMVSTGQWELTANIAGLGDISADHGVIGGRVRDCRCEAQDVAEGGTCDGVRASWPIGGVAIGLAEPAAEIVYFNNLEDDTVPLDFRTTTNILGRYAALDIPAGWNTIAGVTRLPEGVVSVGAASVYVVPDSLSIVGWPGLQPHWRQE